MKLSTRRRSCALRWEVSRRNRRLASELGVGLNEFRKVLCDLRGLNLGSLQELSSEAGLGDRIYQYMPNAPEKDPLHQCLQSELLESLAKAVGELPPRERQMLALYYVEELTLKEVGAVLGVGEARACQIHSAALIRLRARLRELLGSRPAPTPNGECADA